MSTNHNARDAHPPVQKRRALILPELELFHDEPGHQWVRGEAAPNEQVLTTGDEARIEGGRHQHLAHRVQQSACQVLLPKLS